MLLLAFVLLAAPEGLAEKLRHLASADAAWAPSPAPDASRVAFLTTLFGTRQAASMAGDGGYPSQLTDEPGGVVAVRYLPPEAGRMVALVNRGGRRRRCCRRCEGGLPSPIVRSMEIGSSILRRARSFSGRSYGTSNATL